jgi:predicted AAA+ superfamily ATPase
LAKDLRTVAPKILPETAGEYLRLPERDLATLGVLIESAAVHDLMAFATCLGDEVRHYPDSNGHEIDAVVALPDGRWGAVEVKLGAGQIEAGAASLGRALAQLDPDVTGQPTFRLVVTGAGPARP